MRILLLAVFLGFTLLLPAKSSMAASIGRSELVSVRFVNATGQPVDYYLVDPADGSIKPYSKIVPGGLVDQESREGQVWVFGQNQMEIARYQTTADARQAFTIGAIGGAVTPVEDEGSRSAHGADPMLQQTSLSSPAFGDGFSWTYARYVDDYTYFGPTATLSFSVPETDNAQFGATCSRGSGGMIDMTIAARVNPAAAGSEVDVAFSSDKRSTTVNGVILVPESNEAFTGYGFQLDTQAPVWNLFREAAEVRYGIKGGELGNIRTTGIAQPLDAFVRDCATFAAESADPVRAAQLDPFCGYQGTRRSIGGHPLTLRIINATGEYRALYWVDGDGQFVQMSQLNDGEYLEVQTSTGHAWNFTDGPGNCIEAFRPRQGQASYTMTRKSPGFGPE